MSVTWGVLGPLLICRDGEEIVIAARRQRALIALLLLTPGKPLPSERLIDQLWDGSPPPQAAVTLRSYISNIRQALGGRGELGDVLTTRGQGYALDVAAEAVDYVRLQRLAESGRRLLRHQQVEQSLTAFNAAVECWRGEPLPEIADNHAIQGIKAQFTEIYLGACEGRFEALLAAGRHLDALPGLEAFCLAHPLREAPRLLLMTALYRSGRTAEALDVHRRFRALLAGELGIDPSAEMSQLHQMILTRDAALTFAPPTAAPVSADPGLATTGANRNSPTLPGRLVGREQELGRLQGLVDRLHHLGTGCLVLLAGEPGIGKTTLLEHLASTATDAGCTVLVGRSPAASGVPPFWPWRQVIDGLVESLSDDELQASCRGSARFIGQLSDRIEERTGLVSAASGDNPTTLRFLLYEAVSTFLRQAAPGPTLIVLDDIQWADAQSLELLSYLTPSLGNRSLLVAAAYRDLASERTPELEATLATVWREDFVHEVKLTGLSPDQVGVLTTELRGRQDGHDLDPSFVAALHQRTGGNPFFVRQLGRLLLDSAMRPDDIGSASVPPGIRHVIATRVAALGDDAHRFLEAAAVVGPEFDVRLVGDAAELALEDALDACDEAVAHGLLQSKEPEQGFRFVHALVQEAVADSIPAGRALRLEASVGNLLAVASAPVEEVAEHLWRARELVGEAALGPQLSAAESASSVFAYKVAETYLRRALHLAQTLIPADAERELAILLTLFRLIGTEKGWGAEDALEVVARARQLAAAGSIGDDRSLRLWWSLWLFLLDRDDQESVEEVAQAFARGAQGTTDHAVAAAGAIMRFFSALHDRRDLEEALPYLLESRSAVDSMSPEQLATVDEHLDLMLLLIEGHVAALLGDPETHVRCVEAAVALADADGRPFPRAMATTLTALTAALVAEPTVVASLAQRAAVLNERFGLEWLSALSAAVQAWVDAQVEAATGEQLRMLLETLQDMRRAGHHANAAVIEVLLADVQSLTGDAQGAARTLAGTRSRPGPYGEAMVRLVDRRLTSLRHRV